VRQLAIRKLFPLISDVDKIVYGHRYSVSDWPLDGYQSVCSRNSWLTAEEGRRLGAEDVVRIGQVFFSTRVMISDVPQQHIQTHVEQTFGFQPHIISAKLYTPTAVEADPGTSAVTQTWEHKGNALNLEQHALQPGSPAVERSLSPLEALVPKSQPELPSSSVLAESSNANYLKNHDLDLTTAHAMPTTPLSLFAAKERTLIPIDEHAAPSIVGYASVTTEANAPLSIEEYVPSPTDTCVYPAVEKCLPPAIGEYVPVPMEEHVPPPELHGNMEVPARSSPPANTKTATGSKKDKGKGRSLHDVSITIAPELEMTKSDPKPCTQQPGVYEPMPASFALEPSSPDPKSDPPMLGSFDEPTSAIFSSHSLPEEDDWFLTTRSKRRKANPFIMTWSTPAPPPPEVADAQFPAERLHGLQMISAPDAEVCVTEPIVTASLPIASSTTTELQETKPPALDALNAALRDASEKANAAAVERAAIASVVREAETHLFNVLKPVRKSEDATKLWEQEKNVLMRARLGTQKRLMSDRARAAQPAVKEAERVLTVAKGRLEDAIRHAMLAEKARTALLQQT
jgi:hypothetical protein